jgi:hypothetical protein
MEIPHHSPYQDLDEGDQRESCHYRRIAEAFPEAWLEDPDLDDEDAAHALAPFQDRITWDAPIHDVKDILARKVMPRTVNLKPSRFGSVKSLLEGYEFCEQRGLAGARHLGRLAEPPPAVPPQCLARDHGRLRIRLQNDQVVRHHAVIGKSQLHRGSGGDVKTGRFKAHQPR